MRPHPLLRSTRRGWFLAADTGVPSGGGTGTPAVVDPNAPAKVETVAVDYKAQLLTLLSLPAEATDEEINTGLAAHVAPAADQTQVADLQSQLDAAKTRITEFESAAQTRSQEEADELLAEYAELPDETKAVLRETMLADPAKGKALLSAMPKKSATVPPPATDATPSAGGAPSAESAKPVVENSPLPPAPKHDPNAAAAAATAQTNESDKAAAISKRAKEIVASSNPKISLSAAYQKAEAELNKTQ